MADVQPGSSPYVFESAIAWVRRLMTQPKPAAEALSQHGELLLQISRDLNLSASDLEVLANGESSSDTRLHRQLAAFGLSPEIIRLKSPEVMRDLQRVCSGCVSSRTCDRAHAMAGAAAIEQIDCPNAGTMQALRDEADAAEAPAMPIWPCCC